MKNFLNFDIYMNKYVKIKTLLPYICYLQLFLYKILLLLIIIFIKKGK